MTRWSATKCSISSPCWWTSRWWWPTTARGAPATGCWRRCANTPKKNSASPARPTPCAHVTAITTRRWPPCSTRRQAMTMSSASSRPKPRSTTCAPRSGGAAKTLTSSWRWRWRRSLQPLWLARGRLREGLAWFDAALADLDAQHARGGGRGAGAGAGRQGRARHLGGRRRQPRSGSAGPGDRARGR